MKGKGKGNIKVNVYSAWTLVTVPLVESGRAVATDDRHTRCVSQVGYTNGIALMH